MNLKNVNKGLLYGLTTIYLVLFIVMIFRFASGSTQVLTFQGLLDVLSNTPTISVHALSIQEIGGNWLILEPLRLFINTISPVVNVLTFIFINEVNVLLIIGYLLASLFLII